MTVVEHHHAGAGGLRSRLRSDPWPAATVAGVAVVVLAPLFAHFGVPQLPMMAPLYHFGVVLPTCGLTRGVTALAAGKWGRAMMFNPTSPLAAAAAVVLVARAAVGLATGWWMHVRVHVGPAAIVAVCAAAVTLWAYQQSHAQFIIHHMH